MARKVAAQASGAAWNCVRSAALEQQLAAEEARAAENCAKDALLEAYQAELAAKEAQLQELRRDRLGRKSEVLDVGSADGAKHPESLPGEGDPDQPPSGACRPEPPQEGQRQRKRGRQPGQPNC